ncbi:hypothetical protein [Bacillus sp. AG4(2022)]|uniref:hypothetical protein n=1 Tax=Bacillus sp. AG4(2022) TaxID=2962594 RepID=UPI0028811F6B|nr:hypothetical protein [Bacillus sp. AG4(2022)]MDT0160264.1 hypothetical protein [Bacillus sp. AG4(2022)]
MLAPNQTIETTWGTKSKVYLESKGYQYTGIGTPIVIKAEDLTEQATFTVSYICDNEGCEEEFPIAVRSMYRMINKHGTVYCKKCSYERISLNKIKKHKELHSSYDEVELYKKIHNGELRQFPDGFVLNMDINQAKNVVNFLIELLIDTKIISSREEAKLFLSQKNFKKYQLQGMVDHFGINKLLNLVFNNEVKQWEMNMVDDGFWQDDENVKEGFYWFMNKLVEDGTIPSLDNLPKMSYAKKLREYKISGILKRFNNSFSKLANFVDPIKFKLWFFNVPLNYYKDEKNIKEMMDWFIQKLLEDKVITDENDLPKVATRELFKKYKLDSMLTHRFKTSPFYAIDYLYPGRWNRWEYRHVPNDFWNDPNNLRESLIWFVEQIIKDGLISEVSEITSLNISKSLKKYKLATLDNKYDIPFMLSMIYGKDINYVNYSNRISEIDNTKLDSIEEKQIHDLLLKNFDSVIKPSQGDRFQFVNSKCDEMYVPDWIINNDTIVEYFGLFMDESTREYQKRYTDKAKRKIEFFNKNKDYKFIALFPEDLEDNMEGLIKKLMNHGLNCRLINS